MAHGTWLFRHIDGDGYEDWVCFSGGRPIEQIWKREDLQFDCDFHTYHEGETESVVWAREIWFVYHWYIDITSSGDLDSSGYTFRILYPPGSFWYRFDRRRGIPWH